MMVLRCAYYNCLMSSQVRLRSHIWQCENKNFARYRKIHQSCVTERSCLIATINVLKISWSRMHKNHSRLQQCLTKKMTKLYIKIQTWPTANLTLNLFEEGVTSGTTSPSSATKHQPQPFSCEYKRTRPDCM